MNPLSLDLRERIVNKYFEEKISMDKVAKIFRVNWSSVQRLIKQYKATGSIEPKPATGGPPILIDNRGLEILENIVKEKNDLTLEEYSKKLFLKSGIKAAVSTICQAMKKLKITRKKKDQHASEQDTEEVQQQRNDYKKLIKEIDPSKMIFLDETGVNISMERRYARAPIGERAKSSVPKNRGENITLLSGLRLSGIVAPMRISGPIDGEIFLKYIKEFLVPELHPGDVVILDNLSSHKNSEIKKCIHDVEAKLIFLPTYSPDLSPIEECWSKIKEYLRSEAKRTYDSLYKAIEKAFNRVTESDAWGWFKDSGYLWQPI